MPSHREPRGTSRGAANVSGTRHTGPRAHKTHSRNLANSRAAPSPPSPHISRSSPMPQPALHLTTRPAPSATPVEPTRARPGALPYPCEVHTPGSLRAHPPPLRHALLSRATRKNSLARRRIHTGVDGEPASRARGGWAEPGEEEPAVEDQIATRHLGPREPGAPPGGTLQTSSAV